MTRLNRTTAVITGGATGNGLDAAKRFVEGANLHRLYSAVKAERGTLSAVGRVDPEENLRYAIIGFGTIGQVLAKVVA